MIIYLLICPTDISSYPFFFTLQLLKYIKTTYFLKRFMTEVIINIVNLLVN